MYEGNVVEIQMERAIVVDGILDDTIYNCRVVRYELEDDFVYLRLREKNLSSISLDAKYRCYLHTKSEILYCTGTVKERYCSGNENIIVFRIENGFYNVPEEKRKVKNE